MNSEFWYLSRAAGFTAYGLLFLSVVLGLMLTTRLDGRVVRRPLLFDLHRFASLLAIAVTALHAAVLLGDTHVGFAPWQLTVPFASPYRPLAVGLGVLSLYIAAAVYLSFFVRRRIGNRTWRVIHYSTFAMFVFAMLHGVLAGSDTATWWARLVYASSGAVVLALTLYRVQGRPAPAAGALARRRAGAFATAAAAAIVVAAGAFASISPGGGSSGDEALAVRPEAALARLGQLQAGGGEVEHAFEDERKHDEDDDEHERGEYERDEHERDEHERDEHEREEHEDSDHDEDDDD
jgi:hypothetical protein